MDSGSKPCIIVYNKTDLVPDFQTPLKTNNQPAVAVSALDGRGLDEMLAAVAGILSRRRVRLAYFIPYEKTGVLSLLYEKGQVLREEHGQDGISVDAELEIVWAERVAARLKE